jgi:alkylation response protein AidB-like acyl-CoA dehydrogenase
MNFDLSEEQISLRSSLERFVAERYDPQRCDFTRMQPLAEKRERWRELGELGLLALPFSTQSGGLAATAADLSIVMEVFGAALVREPYISSVLMAGTLVDAVGNERQRRDVIGPLLAADMWLALAQAEPEARFSLARVVTSASRAGQTFTLNGRKTCVIDGAGADLFVVVARTSGAPDEQKGISAFLVPADTRGLSKQTYCLADGTQACRMELKEVVLPAESLLGEEGMLYPALESMACRTCIALCSEAVAIAAVLLETTLEHLRSRKQFGVALSSFQAIQHRMADCYVALELARSITLKATLLDPAGDCPEWKRTARATKSFVSRSSLKIAEEAVQFHGAMGITDELSVGRYLKRLLVIGTLFGDARALLEQSHLARSAQMPAWS